ncbi:MAG: FAD:protein FMN transferase [Spirochaetaceae bacterium]|nr:FAD:protein FMN transferase [Spirochaetaceae bacterium]MCF7951479.1 FAD:protein FMN transferase [Spirochaetaceae bacterium]
MVRIKLLLELLLVTMIVGSPLWQACNRRDSSLETRAFHVGLSDCRITSLKGTPSRVRRQVEEMVHSYQEQLSADSAGSQILKINSAANQGPVTVDSGVFEVLQKSITFARLSGGRYDPSAAPLYKLWRRAQSEGKKPSRTEIYAALGSVNFRRIDMNPDSQQVYLPDSSMQVTLEPGLDGYIVDKVADLLQQHNMVDVSISKGVVKRSINGESEFTFEEEVLYENDESFDTPIVTLKNLKARALASFHTSSLLLLNLSTGYPTQNRVSCVASIGPEAHAAEILAHIVAAGEISRGIALVEELPFFEVICVTEEYEVFCTSGFEPYLSDLNPKYTLHVNNSR